ncbi:ATP/GTP-binding protein, partial [Streptomyces endophyticus]|nr:ATP/GTP-binding protein [Streptomyces endophyticus]
MTEYPTSHEGRHHGTAARPADPRGALRHTPETSAPGPGEACAPGSGGLPEQPRRTKGSAADAEHAQPVAPSPEPTAETVAAGVLLFDDEDRVLLVDP